MYDILIESDAQSNSVLRLPEGEHLIGRGDVSIPIDDPSISRHHARLCITDDGVWVEDLGSANGSFIDGLAVSSPTRVEDGQVMVFGTVMLTMRRAEDSGDRVTTAAYAKGEIVAHGGMGAILGARQISMDREVAMKVMLREGDEVSIQRFVHEARITGKLEHPNIVPVHELGTDEDGQVFYTMKFVRGVTLAHLLDEMRTDRLSHTLASLLTVYQKVCDAVAFAHSRGVIHRDLKPENIMIGDFGEVLVMDWGLAKELGAGKDDAASTAPLIGGGAGSTLDGSVLGTPAYMSPEQARGEVANMDARSDIYSLGAILHEILYLRPLVSGTSPMDLIQKVGEGQVDRIGKFRSKHLPQGMVPPSLRAVRRKALAFEPGNRYPSVGDLQADLAAYQSGFATSAEGAGVFTHAALFVKRHQGVSRAITAAAVVTFLLSGWFVLNVIRERNIAENARKQAEDALALVEPARIEATEQRDRATQALHHAEEQRKNAEAQQLIAASERDRALNALEETQAIRRRATDALREMQNAGEIFSKLTEEYVQAGRVEEALENIDRALASSPQNVRYRVARANILQASGRFAQAIPEYRRALASRPDPDVERNLALTEKLLSEQGEDTELSANIRQQLQEALEAQNRALELILLDADAVDGASASSEETMPFKNAEADEEEAPAEEEESAEEEEPEEEESEEEKAEDDPPDELSEDDPRRELVKLLGAYVSQPEWSIERIIQLDDGSFKLDLSRMEISDLSMLHGANVSDLMLNETGLDNLSVVRGLELRALHLWRTHVTDLSPLMGMPLRYLNISNTPVKNITPLEGMPLLHFEAYHTKLGSLEPLVRTPLEHLRLYPHPLSDYSPISKMVHLKTISFPPHAHGIDFTELTKLEQVAHERFVPQFHGWMPARDFVKLSHTSDIAWENLHNNLAKMDAENLTPDRLTVLEPGRFDLDLRGTRVTDLTPLADMPISRLYLDTNHVDLDVSPLTSVPSLRHLVLTGATTGNLRASFPGSRLESIVINPMTTSEDMELLSRHPTLERIGYEFNRRKREPTTSRDEFFHARIGQAEDESNESPKPLLLHRFDAPAGELNGWAVVDEIGSGMPFSWMADPVVGVSGDESHNGRGGGALSSVILGRESRTGYFQAPRYLMGDRRMLLGGCMEFDIVISRNGTYQPAPDVVLISGSKRLVHTFGENPDRTWRRFFVPFDESGGWRVGALDGPLATNDEIRDVLGSLDDLQIRASFLEGSRQIVQLDDFSIWSANDAPVRKAMREEEKRRFDVSMRWGEMVEIDFPDDPRRARMIHLGRNLPIYQRDESRWLRSYKEREGCLLVHAPLHERVAKIGFKKQPAKQQESTLMFGVHCFGHSRASIRVSHEGQTIHGGALETGWQDFELPLPGGVSLSDCVIEIVFRSSQFAYCIFSEIRLTSAQESYAE